jgi:hypothetical protein
VLGKRNVRMKGKSIEDLRFIEAVQERDMDLLLLEELIVSAEFRGWIVEQITGEKIKEFMGAWHSICDSKSEFDIVVLFLSESGTRYAIFIEDKIGAMAQKDQPQRYANRGHEGIVKKEWDVFKTCIVAPKRYLEINKEAKEYDSQLSYEELGAWFLKANSERYGFKNKMIKEAIEQNRRGYTKIHDEKTTDFHRKYHQYAKENYPELEMKEPLSSPIGQSWIYFHPRRLKKKMEIVHKGAWGFVDLQIAGHGEKIDYIEKILNPFMKEDMEIVKTGKSASLRIIVPKVDSTLKFDNQMKNIEKSLAIAKKLLKVGALIVDKI